MKKLQAAAAAIFLLFAFVPSANAKVTGLEIAERVDLLDGESFGEAGPYEKISGTVFFALDPGNPANAAIVDLNLGRNDDGLVEAQANFMVFRPKKLKESVGFLEVSNRGGKASMRYFNRATAGALDPVTADELGDGFLMREGLTVIWVGWQFDVPLHEGLLRLHAPVVTNDGETITGLVRCDWTVDENADELNLGHRDHLVYPVDDPKAPTHRLTVRDGRLAHRRSVPRDSWSFSGGDNQKIALDGGFQSGKIYELVYRAKDPRIVGFGLAAVRDMISYAKYDSSCPFPISRGIAFGVSQTGRFLRHFLYQGFNIDEEKRMAFDGVMIHTAGAGRGSFNHRFAQPSRDAHRYSAFFFPTDIFPFSSRIQLDIVTGKRDGIFQKLETLDSLPKVISTNSGYEYWGRSASLIHTSLEGSSDVELYENERIYHFSSAQHFVTDFPPSEESRLNNPDRYRENHVDFKVSLRALVHAMKRWVTDGLEPPDSRYPRIDDGSLVTVGQVGFPEIPGMPLPAVIHEAYRADYGDSWEHGIIEHQPPLLGPAFATLVSQVDELGNEEAGVKMLETRVPLATYFPWSLRTGFSAAEDELVNFYGTSIPLPTTDAIKRQNRDPRPSVSELYPSKSDYMRQVREQTADLVAERFLLQGDAAHVIGRAEEHWDWIHR